MKFGSTNGIGKTGAILAICFLLLAAFPGSLRVCAQGKAKLTASSCAVQRGDTVSVAFSLEENPGIWGLKFKADYDHSVLKLMAAVNGAVFSDSEITQPESLDRESFLFLGCSDELENITGNGNVVTLMFKVSDNAPFKEYPVTLEILQAIDLSGQDVGISAQKGIVTVEEEDGDEPDVAEPPRVTEVPGITQAPRVTEAPGATQAPRMTEAPGASQGSSVTQAPRATQAPGVTETPRPTQAPGTTQAPRSTEAPEASAGIGNDKDGDNDKDNQGQGSVETVSQINPERDTGGKKDGGNLALWIALGLLGTVVLLLLGVCCRKAQLMHRRAMDREAAKRRRK